MTPQQTRRPVLQADSSSCWRWAWVAAILVWPIFAHGCHTGDHDDELALTPEERRSVEDR
jgi:hypothetical protein